MSQLFRPTHIHPTHPAKAGTHPSPRLQVLLLFIAALLPLCACADNSTLRQDLRMLDDAIQNSALYTRKKLASIDSLKMRLSSQDLTPDKRLELMITISDRYRPVNTDSALLYASRASRVLEEMPSLSPDQRDEAEARCSISLMNALSTAGIFTGAKATYEELSRRKLSPRLKIEFWKAARLLFSYMKTYVATESPFFGEYEHQYIAADDSLLNALPTSDLFCRFIMAERLVRENRVSEAKNSLVTLMKSVPPESNLYGMAAYQLAEVYKREGNTDLFVDMLSKAAVSDIKGCVREGIALTELAQWLYGAGQLHDAFRYINFALSEANAGNARMRSVAIASMMPVIDSAYREKISDTNSTLIILIVLITILFIISLILVILLSRYIRHGREINKRLKAASNIRDSYIGHFISLCASYAGKLDSLTELVNRKISSGQSEELLKLVRSGRFTDAQNDEFYAIFDEAFLEIFPRFIEEINTLLLPDKQFATGRTLAPELRIYALVKLGIPESTRISQVLHYSVSTIYAYRNRMRNRAISRDTFEQDVLAIGHEND